MCRIISWANELDNKQWKCQWWNIREKRNSQVVNAVCKGYGEANKSKTCINVRKGIDMEWPTWKEMMGNEGDKRESAKNDDQLILVQLRKIVSTKMDGSEDSDPETLVIGYSILIPNVYQS